MAEIAGSAETASSETTFVRRSSGLVRELGLLDAFTMNFGASGAIFSITLAFVISQALWAYPSSDVGLGVLLSLVLTLT
jgi:hypothetical protein